jgi:hypothetical protein
MTTQIINLPADESAIHPSVADLAASWRAAADRVKKLTADERAGKDALRAAELKDAADLRTAVLEGKTPPAEAKHTEAATSKLAGILRAKPVAIAERDELARDIAVALRGEDARGALVASVSAALGSALSDYRAELEKARDAVSAAARKVAEASAPLALIESLDAGRSKAELRATIPSAPQFTLALDEADKIEARLAALADSGPKLKERKIVYTGNAEDGPEGRVLTVTAGLAAEFERDGLVSAWLDGAPPEPPAAPVAGGRSVKGGVLVR